MASQIVQSAVDGQVIAGAAVTVNDASSSTPTFAAAFGRRGLDSSAAAMTLDTVMWAASCTKLMTTIAAMQCVERGAFTLDEDIARVVPEWAAPEVATGVDAATGAVTLEKCVRPITLRQLLTHSSGMAYDVMNPVLLAWRQGRGEAPKTLSSDVRQGFVQPLVFQPGDGWAYGPGIDWAGQMVERVNGGVRLGEYMAEHVWKPLDMQSTTFRLSERPELLSRMCGMTGRGEDGKLVANTPAPFPTEPIDDEGGAGSYTTAEDYVKVLTSLLKNDGKVLKPETVREMFAPQLPSPKYLEQILAIPELKHFLSPGMPDGIKWNWGLGGMTATEGVPERLGKGAMVWGGMPNLQWWIDPENEICGIFASQLLPPGDAQTAALVGDIQKDTLKQKRA